MRGGLEPVPALKGLAPYRVPRPEGRIDLRLDANEGGGGDSEPDPEALRRYPAPGALEERLAGRLGIPTSRLLVTDGSNEALDRACRVMLAPGRHLVTPVPTFEMFLRYAALTGAEVSGVPWVEGPYPTDRVIEKAQRTERCAAVGWICPNNPTGLSGTAEDLLRLSEALPDALIIADLAYVEFADEDPTPRALERENVLVVRTLSKAWGLAGVRVGYAAGSEQVITWLRAAGQNYPVSAPARGIALDRLDGKAESVTRFIQRVRAEREELTRLLQGLGLDSVPSEANFVLARTLRPLAVQQALADRGILVRAFPDSPWVSSHLRITCPGQKDEFERLTAALKEVCS